MTEAWEILINHGPFGEYTDRLRVPGGWLYRSGRWTEHDPEDQQQLTLTMCFVPMPLQA